MTKFTKICLLTLAVFAVGIFLGSAEVLAASPENIELVPLTAHQCGIAVDHEAQRALSLFGIDYVPPEGWREYFRSGIELCLRAPEKELPFWHCLYNADPSDLYTAHLEGKLSEISQCWNLPNPSWRLPSK